MRLEPAEGHRLLSPAVLGVACGAMLVPLNSTMLAVALPSVMSEFDVPAVTVTTLVTAYLGTVVITLPLAGALGDRFGHRRTFLAGVVAFAASSLLAAAASAFGTLLLARVLQASSGSLISTSAVALVRAASPDGRRGAAFGIFDMLVTTSAAVGPFVGGLIVGALDWRWTFLLAAPIATLAAVSVGLWHPRMGRTGASQARAEPVHRRLDAPGLLLLAMALAAILAFVLTSATLIRLVAAFSLPIVLSALVWFERRTDQPAIDPRLFSRPAFSAAVAGVLGTTVILHGTFILVPLFVERVMLETATTAGLMLLGISAVWAVAAPLGGRASDRIGRRAPVAIGSAVTAAGLAALAFFVAGQPMGAASAVTLGLLLGVMGAGFGLAGSPRQAAALEAVPSHDVGMAAATYYTGRYLGGVLGATLAGLMLGGTVASGSVALGFGSLAAVAVVVAFVSLGLPGRRRYA